MADGTDIKGIFVEAAPKSVSRRGNGIDRRITMRIGQRLRYRRRELDLSHPFLAAVVNVTFQSIQKYEAGRHSMPATYLWKLSKFLNVSVDYFVAEIIPPDQKQFTLPHDNDDISDSDINTHLGNRLKKLRRSRGITQESLAKASQISCQQIQQYEAGKSRITADRLYQFAEFFSVPLSYFYENLSATPACQKEIDADTTHNAANEEPAPRGEFRDLPIPATAAQKNTYVI